MDEWALLDEVDVIALWPKEKQKNLESSKWQERKDALEVLAQLIEQNPRLSTASMTIYGELMDNLKKIISRDSNVNVVIVALRVLGGLARGLRIRFSTYVSMIWSAMLEKAKDKKSAVQDALSDALDAVSDTASTYLCDVERITKDLCEHLSKPNPQSKQCLCSFLFRYFVRQSVLSMEFAKVILPIIVKLASDSSPSVRDSACRSLGSARRLLGKGLDIFLIPISGEKAKLDKVEEFCTEATTQHAEFSANRLQSRPSGCFTAGDHNEDVVFCAATSSNEPKDVDPWTTMPPKDIVVEMRKDFEELVVSKKWQERKDAFDSMVSIMEAAPRISSSPQLLQIMATVLKVMDKDVNINVASTCAKVLTKLATRMRTDFAVMVPKVMPIAFDKLKEKKALLRNELIELCDTAATTACLECYVEAVCGGLAKSNPQSRAQTALFLSRLLSRHSSSTVPIEAIKQITPSLIKCCSDADGDVREATFRTMAAILRCVDMPAAKRLFGEVAEDKVKMAKVSEYNEKIRAEFGDQASPEILRLYANIDKNPKESATSTRTFSATNVARKSLVSQRVGSRPLTASAKLLQSDSTTIIRAPAQVANSQRRSNVTKTSSDNQYRHVVVPCNPRQGQQVLQQRLPVSIKPTSATSSRLSHVSVKPVIAPNVVRTTTRTSAAVSSGPLKPTANCAVVNGQGPSSLPFSDSASRSSAIVRVSSGLRPPTAVTRTGTTGIPRLSRPSSPAK